MAPPPLDHATVRSIIIGIMLAMFLSALEQTIIAPALPTMGRALGSVEQLSWVVTAYLLSATAATPLFGKLSDIYGRRAMMLTAVGIFIAGSVACALAPNMLTLILARALQGIGGGGILPLSHTIIADLVAPRQRPRYQAYTAVMFTAASIAGPVLGGLLTEYLHWTMIFWINLPLGLAALVMTDRALRKLPRNDRPHQLDLLGAALMVGAALSLMLALDAGSHAGWGSARVFGLIGLSMLLWGLFAARLLTAPEPFIPLTMLKEPIVAYATMGGFLAIGTLTALSIFVPMYLELVLGLSAGKSGIALIAFMAGTVAGSLIAGRLVLMVTHYRWVPAGGLLIALTAIVALAIGTPGWSLWQATLLLGIFGTGMGPMYPLTTVLVQNVVPPYQLGVATGMVNFYRLLGGALVVAVFGAIVLGGVETARLDTLNAAARAGGDFSGAFRWVFAVAGVLVVASMIPMLLMEERPLRGTPAPRAE